LNFFLFLNFEFVPLSCFTTRIMMPRQLFWNEYSRVPKIVRASVHNFLFSFARVEIAV